MSDNTRNHQTRDEGRTLPCQGKTELDNMKDTKLLMTFICAWSCEQSWTLYLKENLYPELDASWFYSVPLR